MWCRWVRVWVWVGVLMLVWILAVAGCAAHAVVVLVFLDLIVAEARFDLSIAVSRGLSYLSSQGFYLDLALHREPFHLALERGHQLFRLHLWLS